ncbi:MAG: signal peptidase I [Legionellaceae bacterium]|nr:signal peptidase I [Legionellaceae bacterium]
MMWNFALILLILSAVTGLLSLVDYLFLRKKRIGPPGWIIEQSLSLFPVFFTVLLVRSFLIEPFRIPSGSLEPTLRVGDFIVVNKLKYGLRLPVFETKILSVYEPSHGDIAVFRWPPSPNYDYIKRVIGIPGDHIQYQDKVLTINGVKADQTFVGYAIDESSHKEVAEYSENFFGVVHNIYVNPKQSPQNFDVVVPPNYYFMMGDNRDNSADSRFWGFVPASYLRGKAEVVWMSWDSQSGGVRWSRLGEVIH